jgi:hypothetical protein
VIGDPAITGSAASASEMGRFETKWLSRPENLVVLADLPGQWINKVHGRRPPKTIVRDMDSSESPTYGEQKAAPRTGIWATSAIMRCSCSTSSTMSNSALCEPVTSIALMAGA